MILVIICLLLALIFVLWRWDCADGEISRLRSENSELQVRLKGGAPVLEHFNQSPHLNELGTWPKAHGRKWRLCHNPAADTLVVFDSAGERHTRHLTSVTFGSGLPDSDLNDAFTEAARRVQLKGKAARTKKVEQSKIDQSGQRYSLGVWNDGDKDWLLYYNDSIKRFLATGWDSSPRSTDVSLAYAQALKQSTLFTKFDKAIFEAHTRAEAEGLLPEKEKQPDSHIPTCDLGAWKDGKGQEWQLVIERQGQKLMLRANGPNNQYSRRGFSKVGRSLSKYQKDENPLKQAIAEAHRRVTNGSYYQIARALGAFDRPNTRLEVHYLGSCGKQYHLFYRKDTNQIIAEKVVDSKVPLRRYVPATTNFAELCGRENAGAVPNRIMQIAYDLAVGKKLIASESPRKCLGLWNEWVLYYNTSTQRLLVTGWDSGTRSTDAGLLYALGLRQSVKQSQLLHPADKAIFEAHTRAEAAGLLPSTAA